MKINPITTYDNAISRRINAAESGVLQVSGELVRSDKKDDPILAFFMNYPSWKWIHYNFSQSSGHVDFYGQAHGRDVEDFIEGLHLAHIEGETQSVITVALVNDLRQGLPGFSVPLGNPLSNDEAQRMLALDIFTAIDKLLEHADPNSNVAKEAAKMRDKFERMATTNRF